MSEAGGRRPAAEERAGTRPAAGLTPATVVLEATTDDWVVVAANDRFAQAVGACHPPVGRPLAGVLAMSGAGAQRLFGLLDRVRRTARPVREARIDLGGEPAPAGGWSLGLEPLVDPPGAVWGVLGTAVDGRKDAEAPTHVDLACALAAAEVRRARLDEDVRRLDRLLAGAVDTTAALVEATQPTAVRRRVLDGLVGQMGFAGAAVWRPTEAGTAELVAAVGLPPQVERAVATLPADSLAARIAAGRERGPAGAPTASSSWSGHRVRLIAVPGPELGVLGVYSDRPLPALVDRVLATVAHALAAAVHQTTLQARARTVVDSLQRELRPRHVVLPEDLEFGSVYRSATAGVDVGGDFFDVFCTHSGHVGLACGDVSGKGVEAASLTAMAVYSLRAYALQGTTPQVVVTMLNGTVCEQTPVERFMTLAYARIDRVSWIVELALAGHPPPLLVGPEGVTVVEASPEPPVGLLERSAYSQIEFALPAGHSLLLYTDGVTEARRGQRETGELLGVERLVRMLHGMAGAGPQELADGVWAGVQEWTRGGTTDDCAIVVLRRMP